MAESYRTEEEQVAALKQWWDENGKSTLLILVVVIAGIFGWEAYQNQQEAKLAAASTVYQNMLAAVDAGNGQSTAEQAATARHLASTLREDYAGTTYAQFAALYQARFAVEDGDLEAARQVLSDVLETTSVADIEYQARLRLARVLYADEQYDAALQQLQDIPPGYATSYGELKGDILRAREDYPAALSAYQAALEGSLRERGGAAGGGLLQLKLEQVQSILGSDSAGDA